MPALPTRPRGFSAIGEVVQICDRSGATLAKILLAPGTIVELAVPEPSDVHLGDRVVVDGALLVRRVETGLNVASAEVPRRRRGPRGGAASRAAVPDRRR